MTDIIRDRVFDIIKTETNRDAAELDPDADIREQVLLDSMQLVAIMARIESELAIELPLSAFEVSKLREFLDIIETELQKRTSPDTCRC